MTQADAASQILRRDGPLHRDQVTSRMLGGGFRVRLSGNTPEESVGRAVTQEIRNRGPKSRFEYVGGKGSGTYRAK
jgi:hypothetical protein